MALEVLLLLLMGLLLLITPSFYMLMEVAGEDMVPILPTMVEVEQAVVV